MSQLIFSIRAREFLLNVALVFGVKHLICEANKQRLYLSYANTLAAVSISFYDPDQVKCD